MPDKKGNPRKKNRDKLKIPPKVKEASQKREKILPSTDGRFTRIQLRDMYRLCLAGYTDKELCDLFRISYDHWNAMLNPNDVSYYADLADTLYAGRDGATAQVARSLYRRANGWSHKATKFFYDSETGTIVSQDYIERYPGDVKAQEMILKNRRPDQWKDRQPDNPPPTVSVAPQINIVTDNETITKLMKAHEEAQAAKEKRKS